MKVNNSKWWILAVTAVFVVGLAGCLSKPKTVVKVEKVVPKPSNVSYAWLGFPQPCPTPADAKILIEKRSKRIVKPGQNIDLEISLKNNESYDISSVTIDEKLPNAFEVTKVVPKPTSVSQGRYTWNLDNVKSGQRKIIKISGKISKVGTVRYSGKTTLNFNVSGKPEGESIIAVIAPNLDLELDAPQIAVVNDRIPIEFDVKNSGTAGIKDARLVHTLPVGILTFAGKSKIEVNIGDIEAGQSKQYKFDLKGEKTGIYNTTFTTVAQNGISASAAMKLKIVSPELNISLKAPKKRFVGNFISYNIKVKNIGDAAADNPEVTLSLPDGVSLSSVNENGQSNKNLITWNISSMHPGETKTFIAKVVAKNITTARAVATVDLDGKTKEAAMTTDIAGISALLSKLVDKHDPVPVGDTEDYELTVTNQGSLPGTKITVKCYLEDSMQYVKSSGATKGNLNGNILTFEQLPLLEPHAEAKWRIVVKAKKAGDVRFKAEVTSDQLTSPVELVESTHFYE